MMKTVAQLIEELQAYPPEAYAAALSAEATGVVIYKPEHGKYGVMDDLSIEADESLGFIELYYSDSVRPPIICDICNRPIGSECYLHPELDEEFDDDVEG